MRMKRSGETQACLLPCKLMPADKSTNSVERFFEYKLEPLKPNFEASLLHVYVMANSLCVLTSPGFAQKVTGVEFDDKSQLGIENISGKKKKGATKVKAGHHICEFVLEDGEKVDICSPVSGQILELNTIITTEPNLILEGPNSGFIAVVLPEDDFMKSLESGDYTNDDGVFTKTKQTDSEKKISRGERGGCFQWSNGNCMRGSNCKFFHQLSPEDEEKERIEKAEKSAQKQASYECFDWMKGTCTRGDSCRFSHASVPDLKSASSVAGEEVVEVKLAAGSSSNSKSKNISKSNSNSNGDGEPADKKRKTDEA